MLEIHRPKDDKRATQTTHFSRASKLGAGNTKLWAIPEVTNVSTRRLFNMLNQFLAFEMEEYREIQRYVLGRDLRIPRVNKGQSNRMSLL